MAELGELLELLYGAHTRFRTARGVVSYRQSMRLGQEAMRRQMERTNRRRGGRASQMMVSLASRDNAEEPPDLYEERQRFWWEPPERLREETEAQPPRSSHTVVLKGELWWTYSPERGATSNVDLSEEERAHHGAGRGERFKLLLDPSPLLGALEFIEIGEDGERLHVRAVPRDDLEGPPHFHLHLLAGADEIELEVDRTTGIVRRVVALLDGEELSCTELEELALDEAFPEETFLFVPPPGEEVRPPESVRRRDYTLEEAAAAAPFTVFYLPELPAGNWRLHVNYQEARVRPPTPAHAWLIYHRADGRGNLSLAQRPADAGGFGWAGYRQPELEQIERDGIPYTVCRGDPERGSQNAVAFDRDGTAIQLQSADLDTETLLALAQSLQPVARDAS